MSWHYLSNYRYRGRHRAPSTTGRTAARLAVAGVTMTAPLALTQPATAGPPGGWDPIIECESGHRNIGNDLGSSASGYVQFIDGTWQAYGGGEFAPRAMQASFEQQMVVAERAYARNGLRDWEASRHCWGGKTGTARHASNSKAPKHAKSEAPRHAAPEGTAAWGVYTVNLGDTLSGIAAGQGTSWPALFELNRGVIANPNLIFPGERLRLP